MVRWGFDKGPIDLPLKWLPAGPTGRGAGDHAGWLELGLYIDSLTIAMVAMITLVALMVHWFSISYMRADPRFSRFFAYLGLFSFSMLALTIAGSLLQLFMFWELVGLCSYLLIGFWYEQKTATNAAIKAFIANGVGDVGFLVGFGLLFYFLGNVTLPRLWLALGALGLGKAVTLGDGSVLSPSMLTAIGICLFCGAIGQERAVPAARLAPGRDGRPHAGVRADPCRHDGGRRRLPARSRVPGPLAGGKAVHRDRRLDHPHARGVGCPGAERHQAGAGLVNGLATRLHGPGDWRRQLDRRRCSTC